MSRTCAWIRKLIWEASFEHASQTYRGFLFRTTKLRTRTILQKASAFLFNFEFNDVPFTCSVTKINNRGCCESINEGLGACSKIRNERNETQSADLSLNFIIQLMCLVTWPMNASEAEGDLALIQTSLLFSFKCQLVSIRTTWFTQQKQWGLYIKTRSPPASLPFKGHVTGQTTVKWFILSYPLNAIQFLSNGPKEPKYQYFNYEKPRI